MKLLKLLGCLSSNSGGNVKRQTTLVEGQGISFRTGVRLPSSPLGKPSVYAVSRTSKFEKVSKRVSNKSSKKIMKGVLTVWCSFQKINIDKLCIDAIEVSFFIAIFYLIRNEEVI